jgi:hypothetical protein
MNPNDGQVLLYDNPVDGKTIEVKLVGETVWLSQKQMAELFDKDSDTIGLHLRNIYAEEELTEFGTTEFFSVVQIEGTRKVKRDIRYYNLDAIISVGYRVSSKRGTIFRKLATQRLKEYLIQGYSINEKRLLEVRNHFNELERTLQFIKSKTASTELNLSEAKGLVDVITAYANSLIVLSRFDSGTLEVGHTNSNFSYEIKYDESIEAIHELKEVLKKKMRLPIFLAIRRIIVLSGYLAILFKHLMGNISMQALKSRLHICYISLSKIIRLMMAINVLEHFCLSGFLIKTNT